MLRDTVVKTTTGQSATGDARDLVNTSRSIHDSQTSSKTIKKKRGTQLLRFALGPGAEAARQGVVKILMQGRKQLANKQSIY
jgi:hypothetical protein